MQQRTALRRQQLLLVALVVLSTALRLWRLDAKGLWWDESLSLYRAQQPLDVILRNEIEVPGSVTTDQHPPLYFVLLSGVVRFGGESDWALRYLSVAWAALLVVLLYLMGTRLRSRQAGLLAALCGALSPFLLWYAQEARMYTMVAALGLAAFYALWRALDERRGTWGLAAALLAIAAVGTQYLFGLVLPCALALAICLWPRTQPAETARQGHCPLRRRHRLALALGISALLVALAAAVTVVVRLLPTLATGRQYIPLHEMIVDALNAYSLGLSVERAQVWPLLLVFAAVYLFGVASLWRRPPVASASPKALRWAGLVMSVGYVLVPILGMWVLSLFVPIYMGSRYVLLSSPAFYLGLGLGLEALRCRWRWPAWVVGAVLVAAMGLSTYRYFGVDRYAAKEDHRGAALTIAAAERPGDAVIVTAPENVPVFAHYYRGRAPIIAMPAVAMTGNPDPATVAGDLAAAIAPYERVWLVHCRTEFSDPQNLVTQWLDAHALLLRRATLPSWGSEVTLSAYLTRPALEAAAESVEAQGMFGGQLGLEDVTLRYYASDGAEREAVGSLGALQGADVAPGSVMSVRLAWRVGAAPEDLRTSLRLVDAAGVIWSQNDADPYLYWPTHEWPVGAAVRQEADLRVLPGTPPGRYRVELWVYRAGDGAVLPFQGADGGEQPSVALGEVAVSADGSVATGEPWPPEAATRTRWNSSFARLVQLQGYLLSPQHAAPGEAVALQLYWRALADGDRDLALEIQWRDAQDRVWHSTQQSLTGSDYGTAQWRADQRLRGLLWLEVPANAPPGRHRLHLVVRDGVDGEPMWVHYGPLWGANRDLPTAFIEIE